MKKLITYGGILFGLGLIFSKAKSIYDNLSLKLAISNLRVIDVNPNTLTITFLSDILLTNTNGVPLYAPIHLQDISFFANNINIGSANIDKDNIFIGNNETKVLKDIQLNLIFKDYNQLFETLKQIRQLRLSYNIAYLIAGKQFNYTGNYV